MAFSSDNYHRHGVWGLLERYALEAPDTLLYTFLGKDGKGQSVSVAKFHQDANAAANHLWSSGARPGDLLLISINQGYETAALFWGALRLGAIPSILAYSPPLQNEKAYSQSMQRLVEFTGAAALVIEPEDRERFFSEAQWRLIPKISSFDQPLSTDQLPLPDPAGDSIAYIQFSSGTTGKPKGVVLTHAAIIDYLDAMHQAWKIGASDVFVGWLPLFHDMGLTIELLQPVFSRNHSVLFSPTDWLLKPYLLFEAVQRYKGSITWMPNFAFNYCQRHVSDEQISGVDLSSWRILGCASEPVQMETLDSFADRFQHYGLDKTSIMIAYGLAENVAAVTLTPLESPPVPDWVDDASLQSLQVKLTSPHASGARALASCGFPIPKTQIVITGENGEKLGEREVGTVMIKSPFLFTGYHLLPQETSESLHDGWLNTGDIGYIHNGQLFICGRKKELIIIRGRNLLPHHIEEIAASTLGKDLRYAVAIGIEDRTAGTEMPILICEMRSTHPEVQLDQWTKTIRERVNQILQVNLEQVLFVKKGWIIKTTSGKINHAANRKKFTEEMNRLEKKSLSKIMEFTKDLNSTQVALYTIWSRLLKTNQIELNDDFFKLGGDSLAAVELIMEVEARFGVHIPSSFLFQNSIFSDIVDYIDQGGRSIPETIIVPIQPAQSKSKRRPFFCVHPISGEVLGYWGLSKLIGAHQPFYGIQAHGINGTGMPDKRVEVMARRYIEAIRQVQPKGPYTVGGYCFGGLVAFEMAQQLVQSGEEVQDVIIIDFQPPPKHNRFQTILDEFRRINALLKDLPNEWKKYRSLNPERKKARRMRVQRRLHKRLQQLFGREVILDLEDTFDLAAFSPSRQRIDAAIVEAYYHYAPKPYPGSLTLLRTRQGILNFDRSHGWKRLSLDGVRIFELPGSHDSIIQQPNVTALADLLRELLQEN